MQCHSKLGNECLTILFNGAYFLLAAMIEGDESSQLKMAIKLAGGFGQLQALIDSPAWTHNLNQQKGLKH